MSSYDKAYAQQVLGAKCDECPLQVGGRFVPSVGPDKAELAFVGEAPGIQEAKEGTPFIGPSGRLLNIVNNTYGINRNETLLTNACLCRPADGSTPAKAAIQACRPRLLHELRERRVSTVVGMGNSAALGLLGVDGITRLRVGPGRTSPYAELAGVRVIPTIHPAACLRQSDMFPSLVKDVGKVGLNSEPWSEPLVEVFDDPADAINVLRSIEARAGDLVVDIEVDIDKENSYDHPDRYDLLCVGLAYEKGYAVVIGERALEDGDVRRALGDTLRASNLIAHNGKFDLAGLHPVLGNLELSADTMLGNYALDERPGIHGLKFIAVEDLGAPAYDAEIGKYVKGQAGEGLEHFAGYGRIPRPILYKYCGYDCAATFDIRQQQKVKLATQKPLWWNASFHHWEYKSLADLHEFLVEASNELKYLELNGLAVDRPYQRELEAMFLDSIASKRDTINEILASTAYDVINPNSPVQVKKALRHLRAEVESTNEDTLKLIMDKCVAAGWSDRPLYAFCERLLEYRREAKLYGTYVKGIRSRLYRGRVYSTYLLHGSTTGRLASRNPNLQNIAREKRIKRQFAPGRPENVFVQADYSQAELRVLSWLAHDTYFRDILNDPTRDLFDELTPRLFPQLPPKAEVHPELWTDVRVRVKAFVYGLNYGRSEFGIAQEYDMLEKEARDVKDRFFETIPEIVEFQRNVKKHVRSGKDLITPFGRHRRFHLITQENWKQVQNEALAFLPQSTSSDVCLRAMVRVRRDLRGSGAFIRNIVHDSILVDCPSDMATDVASLLDRRMVESAQELVGDYVTFRTDTKIGKNWGEV